MFSFLDYLCEAKNKKVQDVKKAPVQDFKVHTTDHWSKSLAVYPQVSQQVATLEKMLSIPRTQMSSDHKLELLRRFKEHPLKNNAGETAKERAAFAGLVKDHTIYRYHLPSAKGLTRGRITLNVAYAKDHSNVKLFSVTEHQ